MRLVLLSALCVSLAACETVPANDPAPAEIRHYVKDAYKEAGFPFSSAVEADGWIYLAGELGTTPEAGLVPGGIEPETRQTMDNIQATLAANDLNWDNVVKCTVFLADIAEWPAFNEVYKTYFTGNYPARSALGANGLALGARVEIECIAKR
ncbi:MAG: RidA family protein [Henriciella sp.]|nr:RidA family protein [Henriciella sp.]